MFSSFEKARFEEIAQEEFITVSDGTILRVLKSKAPEETSTGYTLFMVPGWGSVVLGWDDVLLEAMNYFDIVYLETREKGSSKLAKKSKNNLDRFSTDVADAIEILKLDLDKTILFSSSFGSAVAADGLGKNKFDFFLNILIAPAVRIDLPIGLRYLVPITPHWFMKPVKPIVKHWLKHKKSESPEQAAKYIRVMNEADSKKWKKTSMSLLYWEWWPVYERVDNDIILVAAEEDKMHEAEITMKLGELMENSIYINLKSNKNTHSKPIVDLVREQLNNKLKLKDSNK